MYYLMLALCAVSFTFSIFLFGKFGIKKKDNIDYISFEKDNWVIIKSIKE